MHKVVLVHEFDNEMGNAISMTATLDDEGITICATGPTSTVENTWTQLEAHLMVKMLTVLLDDKFDYENLFCLDDR